MAHTLQVWKILALIFTTHYTSTFGDTITKHKVIIIGAGMSGIGFAETLQNDGERDFIILEARKSAGGRMLKAKFSGYTVNLGAGWIHEADDDNPVWRFKKKYGLATTPDNYSNFVVRNEKQEKVGVSQLYKQLRQTIGKVESFIAKEEKKKRFDIPMRTALKILGWRTNSPVKEALDYYANDFENGNPPWVLSSRHAGFTGQYPDQVVIDSRGYSYIPEQLVKPFASKIQYNTVVNKIEYNKTSVTVFATQNGVNVRFHSSYVVTTFSTGVLASSNVQFKPKLPDWKMEAVYKIPMGFYSKIFLKFPTKFWDDSYYILSASKVRGHLCHWQNLDRLGIYSNSKLLLLTVTGPESVRMEELSDKEIMNEALTQLQKLYGNSIPGPTDVKIFRWSKDPLTVGAYSSPAIGAGKDAYLALRAPVDKSLWFTGEATDSEYYGYTHGAYIIGKQQAKRYLDCIHGKGCPTAEGHGNGDAKNAASIFLMGLLLLISFAPIFSVSPFEL